jgi:hypothetical protein
MGWYEDFERKVKRMPLEWRIPAGCGGIAFGCWLLYRFIPN